MVTELLQKFIWMVQTFIRAGQRGLSLSEIEEKWERRFCTSYSRRTFNNHRSAIEEVFGVRIECNRSTNRYYIESPEDVSDGEAESAWLINTFTVNNVLALSKERLSGRVSVEDIPSGHRHLTGLMEAMTTDNEVRISYRKYTSAEAETLTVRPYAVKEFAKRWYLIGYCIEREGLRVYGMDRILDMELTDKLFEMPEGFDVDEMFATSFGIYLPEEKARFITFRASRSEARYLRDLPLHSSQEEIGMDGDKVVFRLFVCPDNNLTMELCRLGDRVEVMSPPEIRNAVAEAHRAALQQYLVPPCGIEPQPSEPESEILSIELRGLLFENE